MEKLSGLLAAYKAGKHPSGLAREYGVMQKTVEAALVRAAREHLGLPICPPKIHERAKNHNVWVEWLDEDEKAILFLQALQPKRDLRFRP